MLVACTPVSDTRHVPPAAESTAADASETNNAGAGAGKAEERARLALGPMLGHVSPNTARIWIKAASGGRAAIMIGRRHDLGDGRVVDAPRLDPARDFAATIDIDGLSPATRYFFVVVLDGAPIRSAPYDSFMTAPRVGARGHLRFAFVSCVGSPRRAAEGWRDMSAIAFDMVLQLGDNHYANSTEPRVLRSNYRAHRSSDGFKAISARVPILGIWDDHDFARDNSDGTAPGKQRALATFEEHWPNPAFAGDGVDGIYFRFSRGDVEFFMLDGRYHRSPNRKRDTGDKTMLGGRQLAWLKTALRRSEARIKFIASGTEWQSYGTTDSWKGFRRERDELFRFIDDNGIEGVVLLSGDRHLTAGYHVLDRFVEITTGPLGSRDIRAKRSPERFFLHDQGRYFSIFDIDTRPAEPVVKLEIHRVGEGLVETRSIPWARINPRPPPRRRLN